jgi:aminotransferase in exopolysaccharide biosynthesis
MQKNKMIPLSVPNLSMDILPNVQETIETGWVSTGGRFIEIFESKMKKYVKSVNAVAVQSGTAGIHLALSALNVGNNDEVIVPTLTFIAAINPVKYVGAEPVFIDCGDDMNIDPYKIELFLKNECEMIDGYSRNKRSGKIVKAIVVVHVFGNPANMEAICKIARKYNVKIIEDATEALGSYYTSGEYSSRYCGTVGDIGIYSFNANKIITTGGGGIVVSSNEELLDRVRFLGVQAKTDPLYYVHDEIGYNYRMTNIQAAFGVSQIDELESFIETKKRNYYLYKEGIESIEGLELFPFNDGSRPNYWFYTLIVDEKVYGMSRDELLLKLNERNVQSRPLWGLIHKQKPYLDCHTVQIERASYFEKNVLNIPCSSNLEQEDVKIVLKHLKELSLLKA